MDQWCTERLWTTRNIWSFVKTWSKKSDSKIRNWSIISWFSWNPIDYYWQNISRTIHPFSGFLSNIKRKFSLHRKRKKIRHTSKHLASIPNIIAIFMPNWFQNDNSPYGIEKNRRCNETGRHNSRDECISRKKGAITSY